MARKPAPIDAAAPMPPAPPRVQWLVQLLGPEAAFAVVERAGGTSFWVPPRFTKRSMLVRVAGVAPEQLAPLAETHSGERITVPVCREWRVQVLRARGLSIVDIARALGMHEDTVSRTLKRERETARDQMEFAL